MDVEKTAKPVERFGNPALRCKARDADFSADDLKNIVKEMEDSLHAAKGLGLAGPQIGILKRVFIYDLGEGTQVMINPEMIWRSEEEIEDTEGCLSIPGYEMTVSRAARVRVEARDPEGQKRTVEAEGMTARLFQHEIDHLNGVLIIDRTSPDERREVIRKIMGSDLG